MIWKTVTVRFTRHRTTKPLLMKTNLNRCAVRLATCSFDGEEIKIRKALNNIRDK